MRSSTSRRPQSHLAVELLIPGQRARETAAQPMALPIAQPRFQR